MQIETHSSTLAWKIPWMEEPGELRLPWDSWDLKESDTTEQLHWFKQILLFIVYSIMNRSKLMCVCVCVCVCVFKIRL